MKQMQKENTEETVKDINDRGERINVPLIRIHKVEERKNGAE